jgi:pyridoxal phosphate enzyme (YggS family)
MGVIAENIQNIRKNIPDTVKLIVVSKFKPVESIAEAYQVGQRLFGENKTQEMSQKQQLLPPNIQWHFIGHLQTNKIKQILPFVTLIHSVDSMNLLAEINRLAQKQEKTIDCLLQFHIATEESKFGFSFVEAEKMLASPEYTTFQHVRLCGVMGMATFTDNTDLIRSEFKQLRQYFLVLKEKHFSLQPSFTEISMGMTQDYAIAIEEGATMVRIGSAIFQNAAPKV